MQMSHGAPKTPRAEQDRKVGVFWSDIGWNHFWSTSIEIDSPQNHQENDSSNNMEFETKGVPRWNQKSLQKLMPNQCRNRQ